MKTDDYEYELPGELIAHMPSPRREGSRLMVLRRPGSSTRGNEYLAGAEGDAGGDASSAPGAGSIEAGGSGSSTSAAIEHSEFGRVAEYLAPGDLLVVNDTKVIKARLEGRKRKTGGAVELLLLKPIAAGRWEALVSPSRRLHPGTEVVIGDSFPCRILERLEGARRVVEFSDDIATVIDRAGKVPLPPYIKREAEEIDLERYQTVYADKEGSVAAPTAGLHFSDALIEDLKESGVEMARLTLHVGIGTFLPVKSDDPRDHQLEPEYFEIDQACCDAINRTRRSGGRVVAVGTTSVRTLETVAEQLEGERGEFAPRSGWTPKFILPSYDFRAVDALITNFHLPRSTLLMLVCAFAGREFILDAYREAIRERYRFFSYGDAMLIL
jgi:S-adenosylmethionine:tRNA ribosyltransferase-isomerase